MPRTAHLAAVAWLAACTPAEPGGYEGFTNPERVAVQGYEGDVMEPFLTKDGAHLLFNNRNDPAVNTDLHCAERVEGAFVYRGRIAGVNTPALEGVPSVDRQGALYFVSTRSYEETLSTIYARASTASRPPVWNWSQVCRCAARGW